MLLCNSLTTPTISHQEASACYVKAFLAPVSWTTLITQSDNNIDLNDYDALLWAAKPALQNMPSSTINLPSKAGGQRMKKMCVFFICLAHFLHCLVSFSFFLFFLRVVKLLLVSGWGCSRRCLIPCLTIKGLRWSSGQKSRWLTITSTAQPWDHLTPKVGNDSL